MVATTRWDWNRDRTAGTGIGIGTRIGGQGSDEGVIALRDRYYFHTTSPMGWDRIDEDKAGIPRASCLVF